ncbi:hypothetical protein ACFXJ5_08940 [Streptomyces sp. NPDC059373]
MPNGPEVAFSIHPELGIVAAVADELPNAEAALRTAGFHYINALGIFALQAEANRLQDKRLTARLVRDLQAIGYIVAADPQLLDAPPPPSVADLTARVLQAERPSDVADVFDDLLDDRTGVIPELHKLLEASAAWSERNLGYVGADAARSCRHLAAQINDLSEYLGFTGGDFLDLDALPRTHPAGTGLSDTPARARAATATSPTRSGTGTGTGTPTATNAPAPDPAAQVPTAPPTRSR